MSDEAKAVADEMLPGPSEASALASLREFAHGPIKAVFKPSRRAEWFVRSSRLRFPRARLADHRPNGAAPAMFALSRGGARLGNAGTELAKASSGDSTPA